MVGGRALDRGGGGANGPGGGREVGLRCGQCRLEALEVRARGQFLRGERCRPVAVGEGFVAQRAQLLLLLRGLRGGGARLVDADARAFRGARRLLQRECGLTLREGQPLAIHEREALALSHPVALLRAPPLDAPADLGANRHHPPGFEFAGKIQPVLDARRLELHDLDPGHPLGRDRGCCRLADATGDDVQHDQQGADAHGVALGDVHVLTTPFFPGPCSTNARARVAAASRSTTLLRRDFATLPVHIDTMR